MFAWLKLLASFLQWALLSSILVCVYFLLVVPVGLVLRLMGRDPMKRDFSKTATSYWEDYGRGHKRDAPGGDVATTTKETIGWR